MKKFISIVALVIMCLPLAFAGNQVKTNYRNALILAYSPTNSVFEDDNIKLEIYNEKLYATNKTTRTIFIDLSQCFLLHNGSSYPMFEKHQDDSHASKKKVSTNIDEFLSIAPSTGAKQNETFICNLASGIYGKYTTAESPSGTFTEYEERMLSLVNELLTESLEADPKGKEYRGTATRHLTEDESISNIGASIAYAFNKRSEEWTPVTISTWVCDVYFAPYYVEMPADIKKKDKRGFGVKKTEASKLHVKADTPFEFEQDKSPIIVFDWTGDFKKGEFTLNYTWVTKQKGANFGKILGATFLTMATGGFGALLLTDNEKTFYKKEIVFDGENSNWGKMKYFDNKDLSKFDNKR